MRPLGRYSAIESCATTVGVVGLCKQEVELKDEILRVVKEKELLSHSLDDRNAELQLQISKTSVSLPMLVTVVIFIVSCCNNCELLQESPL